MNPQAQSERPGVTNSPVSLYPECPAEVQQSRVDHWKSVPFEQWDHSNATPPIRGRTLFKLAQSKVSGYAVKVFLRYAQFAKIPPNAGENDKGYEVWCEQAQLMALCKCSDETIRSAKRELVDLELLKPVPKTGGPGKVQHFWIYGLGFPNPPKKPRQP